ncbi:unnamed protein product, partial [Meganyctiphanes norvegica]
GNSYSPFLNIGVMLAFLQSSGVSPALNDSLNVMFKDEHTDEAVSLSTCGCILSRPLPLNLFNFSSLFFTISGVISMTPMFSLQRFSISGNSSFSVGRLNTV